MGFKLLALLFLFGCIFVHSVNSQSFAQQCLNAHNSYRARHGSPRMVLDNSLNNYAQQWANHLLRINRMQHRPNNRYGENIYWSSGRNVNGGTAVTAWYNEIRDYNYNRPGFSARTGHFTQVVWRGSTRLGCAIARRGNTAYVVANYAPAGNVRGQFPQNVRRPR